MRQLSECRGLGSQRILQRMFIGLALPRTPCVFMVLFAILRPMSLLGACITAGHFCLVVITSRLCNTIVEILKHFNERRVEQPTT